ncbi:hypothetical protein [Methylobacterium goesingense]|uniref:Cysteine rich repeat-containing protein n=1 Tax=Methylobacterium goesingense TaxID=243690 RepID=A0ABV2L9Y4_9HYPH|nr:hypothetical protein [Methylobacterium goesingense]GJD72240.1 hypothetical protein CFIICLFH_0453 [Methylobacterium goesingense]
MNRFRSALSTLILVAISAAPSSGQPSPDRGAVACRDEIGPVAAKRLAAQCRDASPATHPPCNVVNPCAMMRDEIERSCRMFRASSPLPADLCAAGRGP